MKPPESFFIARRALPASLVLCATVAQAACSTTANPSYCDEDTPCATADAPFCDLAGEFPASGGVANRCIPAPEQDTEPAEPECTLADTFVRCDGDTLVRCSPDQTEETQPCAFGCNPDAGACNECTPGELACTDDTFTRCDETGTLAEQTDCPLGCHATDVRCNQMVPSNISADYLALAARAGNYTVTGEVVFDTDEGTVTDGDGNPIPMPSYEVEPRFPSEIGLRIFTARSLTLGDARSQGKLGLVLVAADEFTLDGDFIVRAGQMPLTHPCKGADGDKLYPAGLGMIVGCGGGGGRVNGGPGGDGYDGTAGGPGGQRISNPSLRPLRGGCSGGFWPSSYSWSDGGGALQVVAGRHITLQADAIIDANAPAALIAGGGSGGGILLEAPMVSLSEAAGLFANGAAGNSLCGGQGGGGQRSAKPAQPYDCNRIHIAASGTGGTGRNAPGEGDPTPEVGAEEQAAGNGGGSAGYIRINTRDGNVSTDDEAQIEPDSTSAALYVQ